MVFCCTANFAVDKVEERSRLARPTSSHLRIMPALVWSHDDVVKTFVLQDASKIDWKWPFLSSTVHDIYTKVASGIYLTSVASLRTPYVQH